MKLRASYCIPAILALLAGCAPNVMKNAFELPPVTQEPLQGTYHKIGSCMLAKLKGSYKGVTRAAETPPYYLLTSFVTSYNVTLKHDLTTQMPTVIRLIEAGKNKTTLEIRFGGYKWAKPPKASAFKKIINTAKECEDGV